MTGEDPATKRKKAAQTYMRLSGIGFQMAAIIGIGAYGGWWIDQHSGVAIAMYILFKETRV